MHPSTLRAWTRAGRLEAFVTPGGHRRYRAADLEAFPTCGRSSSAVTDAGPGADPDRSLELASLAGCLLACQRRCGLLGSRDAAARPLADISLLCRADADTRDRLRLLGASLLRQLTVYLLANRDAVRERCLAQAREDVAEYGVMLARLGLAPAAAIEAFTTCRAPILQALRQWIEGQPMRGPSSGWPLDRAHHVLDQALVSMVAAHEATSRDLAPREVIPRERSA